MVYRNDYTALVVVFLIVLLCTGVLGALVYDKALQVLTPSSAPIGQPSQSPIPQPTATPTATPTPLSAMALAQPTFIAQTVTAGNVQIEGEKVTRENTNRHEMIVDALFIIGVFSTIVLLALGIVRITRTQAIKAEVRLREAEALAKEAEAKVKAAEAQVAIEQRRLAEVQAIQAREQARLAQAMAALPASTNPPRNGNGHEMQAGVTASRNQG